MFYNNLNMDKMNLVDTYLKITIYITNNNYYFFFHLKINNYYIIDFCMRYILFSYQIFINADKYCLVCLLLYRYLFLIFLNLDKSYIAELLVLRILKSIPRSIMKIGENIYWYNFDNQLLPKIKYTKTTNI